MYNVLVADGELHLTRHLLDNFDREHYHFVFAETQTQALNRIDTPGKKYDLVVIDIRTTGIHSFFEQVHPALEDATMCPLVGRHLVRILREERLLNIPVLIYSADPEAFNVAEQYGVKFAPKTDLLEPYIRQILEDEQG